LWKRSWWRRQSALGAPCTRHTRRRRGSWSWNARARRWNCWPAWAKPRAGRSSARGANFLAANLRPLLSTLLQTARGAGKIAIRIARQEGFVGGERIERDCSIPRQHFRSSIKDRTHSRNEACFGIQRHEFLISVYCVFLNDDVVGCAFGLSLQRCAPEAYGLRCWLSACRRRLLRFGRNLRAGTAGEEGKVHTQRGALPWCLPAVRQLVDCQANAL